MATPRDHRITVTQSSWDGLGVRLDCTCGWNDDWRADPTVDELELAALTHRAAARAAH